MCSAIKVRILGTLKQTIQYARLVQSLIVYQSYITGERKPMLYIKQIKTPDIAKAIGMSVRNIRRYEYGELKMKFIKGAYSKKKIEEVFNNAKIGLLVETFADPKINETLLTQYKCQKPDTITNAINELERLAKVGKLIGSWYFNEDFKKEMVK